MTTRAGDAWRRDGRVAGAALGAVAAGGALLWLFLPLGVGDRRAQRLLPPAPEPGLAIPKPALLDASARRATRWAPVRTAVVARRAPGARAAAIMRLEPRTPERTSNLVVVLREPERREGRLWVRVLLPARAGEPLSGWVPRRALGGYRVVRTRLLVDLSARRVTLLREGRVVMRAPVGIGLPSSPTPRGDFYVRNRLERYASPFYGPLAFGTSARSRISDWPAGGFVGIHGTNRPGLVPGPVSRGCLRLRNRDVLRLGRLMPVGTPVSIR